MTKYSIKPVIKNFNTELKKNFSLIKAINKLHPSKLSAINEERIIELAFLKIYAAWESYLENIFIRYMTGAKSLSGIQPVRYVIPPSIDKARYIYSGTIDGRVSWSGEQVRQKSVIYFKDGEPFTTAINSIKRYLDQMVVVRNSIAHSSSTSYNKFKELAKKELPTIPFKKISTPGKFLLSSGPNIPSLNIYFEFYSDMLKIAVEDIAR